MDESSSRLRCDLTGDQAVQVMDRVARVSEKRLNQRHGANRQRALRPPIGIVAASICGGLAAVFYTLANIALRQCVGVDPFLVSAVKAVPTVLVMGPFLGWMFFRGETIATSSKMIPRLIVTSFVAQLVGNTGFQIALGVIGLAAMTGVRVTPL